MSVTRRAMGVMCLMALTACSSAGSPGSTVVDSTTVTTTTEGTTSTSLEVVTPPVTESFSIPVGPDGVTYQRDGEPPTGPSSFVVLGDGSVVVADTMAADRGEPRLVHYDRFGSLISVIDLSGFGVAAVVDVEKVGNHLAVLDVHTDRNIYRILQVGVDGRMLSSTPIPQGSHFENGLTGLASDDSGVLLEFEFGHRYERLAPDGSSTEDATLTFGGLVIEVLSDQSKTATVRVGDAEWQVSRRTDLGGVTLVGVTDDAVVVVVDEVDSSGASFTVTRRIQRYSHAGDLLGEAEVDAGDQEVEVARPLELSASGDVIRMWARPDTVEFVVLDV